ncbi:MAG: hypothetical protein Q4G34_11500, partial [Micrococcus sp.]|nr:hypothetical protein [Micrococcus sp.]
ASPTTAGPTGDRESATPTSRAQAEATSDSDTGSGGLPLGMTPIMLLHPGDSLPDWDLTVAMEEAGVYELRSNANSCLMRVGLERMPGAEAQYDTDAEATQSIVQQRLEGRESAVTVTGTQQVNLGMFGADHFEAHRYDASLLSEETLEPGHAVGLTRMFLEPEPSLWQTFYTCDVDDFDEDAFQDFLTSFGVVGDVEPSLED